MSSVVLDGWGAAPDRCFSFRFSDPNALYLGIKGGSPSLPHGHMDVGSFVLAADEEVWAADLGMQEYESLEKEKISLWDASQGGDRWKIFRLGPESHNILRFNGQPQLAGERADFIQFRREGEFPNCVLDLTALYQDQTSSVKRGAMFLCNQAVLIQDEWTAGKQPVEVTWQMLTAAEVAVGQGGELLLSKSGKSHTMRILDFNRETISVTIDLEEKFRNTWDTPNPGYSRISIHLQTVAGEKGSLRMLFTPGRSQAMLAPVIKNLDEW